MKSALGPSRSPDQVCTDVAVGLLGLVGVGATLASVGTITAATYLAIVMYDPSLGGRDFADFGIAGLVGLVTGAGITVTVLATVLHHNRNRGDYKKIIGTSAVMIGLATVATPVFVVILKISGS